VQGEGAEGESVNADSSNGPSFIPHEVLWDDGKISRYWDHLSQVPTALDNCWSKQAGKALVLYVTRKRPLQGRILDYGCGPGFLVADLLEIAGTAVVYGVEHSPESVRLVNSRFQGHQRFGGVLPAATIPTGYATGYFDTVFFVETIEHLQANFRLTAVKELKRLLRSGGMVVVTTPNEENMESSKAICPDCGARFHVVQHLSSWSAETLRALMEEVGFKTVSCSPAYLRSKGTVLAAIADRILRRRLPHLIYLGITL